MWFDSDNAEGIEPSFGLVGAVADDKMITIQRLVVEIIPVRGRVKGVHRVAIDHGIGPVADADGAVAQTVVKLYAKRFFKVGYYNVRAFHVAVHQRALDVDFVLVVGLDFFAGTRYEHKGEESENDSEVPVFHILAIIWFYSSAVSENMSSVTVSS